ncbi:hypothetical protein D3C72_2261130 [compost metagenome]
MWFSSQRPRCGSCTLMASSTAISRPGRPMSRKALRQPWVSTSQAPTLRPMIAEKVGAAVKQLMANERRCGG